MEEGGGCWLHRIKSGYFYQVSMLDYFLGSEPKVGVTFSAAGGPFFVLQDSRSRIKLKCSETSRTEGFFLQADTEEFTGGIPVLFIQDCFLHHQVRSSTSLDQIKKNGHPTKLIKINLKSFS